MPKKPKINKSWHMPTDEFIDIWVDALRKKPADQWTFMVTKCWLVFSKLEKNENHLNEKVPGWKDDANRDACIQYITDKVYSKCSNIRTNMKDNTSKDKPKYPEGRNLKTKPTVDWDGQASKFPANAWEPVEEDSTEPESEDKT